MSWMRGLIALLAVCVVLVTGSVSCGASGAQERKDGQSVSPVGKVLDDTDEEGRHYREVDKDNAPDVGIQVQPNSDDSWSVRLTIENFTFSPAGTKAKAVSGRGVAVVFVDDRPVTTLRAPSCRLAAAYVPQGTHKVTARLYADDGTVWAVDGDPVESTADVTASEPQPAGSGGGAAKPGSLEPQDGSTSSRVTTGAGGELPDARVAGAGAGEAWTLRAATDTGGGVSVLQAGTRAGGGVSVLWAGAGSGGGAGVSSGGGVTELRVGAGVSDGVSEARVATSVGGGR